MERIIIIGCGGSGKSTLARKMGEKTGLPVVYLDQIWWSPGNWQHLEREEFDKLLQVELEKEKWIMDGNFDRTVEMRLPRADVVIYLDFPFAVCFFGWLKRVIRNWGRTREDMGPGCAEHFDPEFVKWLWEFNRTKRAKYYSLLGEQKDKTVHIFKNRSQVRKFLQSL